MMIDRETSGVSISGLNLSNLVGYLRSTNWAGEREKVRWYSFVGGKDAHGSPLEIVLPRDPSDPDLTLYIRNAVDLLSAVADEPVETTIRKIHSYDRDVLRIRNLVTGEENSISLHMAWRQVTELKQLVTFSAQAEQYPRPFYRRGQVDQRARRMTMQYRFGHTFHGSFGLTVECPIVHEEQVIQMEMFEEAVVIPPIERRVMERIIRGLVIAEETPRTYDTDLLKQYRTGLNANMCTAILGITQKHKEAVEFNIDWSLKMQPSEDIRDQRPIRLSDTSYSYLEDAARELRKIRPEPVIVRGLVESLTAKGNPRSLQGSDRLIIVKWSNPPEGRSRNIMMRLESEDYLQAIHAHEDYKAVEVQGELQLRGSIWSLSNVSHFRVL